MADIVFVAVLVAFFALAVAFVRVCEQIVGPDVDSRAVGEPGDSSASAA